MASLPKLLPAAPTAPCPTAPPPKKVRPLPPLMPSQPGLPAAPVLLPSEDAALYETHLAQFREQYQPVIDQELALVQSFSDTHSRIAGIPSLEIGNYALGRLEFADLFPDYEEALARC